MTLLHPRERAILLRLARAAIEEQLSATGVLRRMIDHEPIPSSLREVRGAFVTLLERRTVGHDHRWALRGCIGTVEPAEPLFESVIQNATHAAFADPRFPRLEAQELPGLRIELSALGPLVAIRQPAEIVVGRDGVELRQNELRSVFLPQVAVEHGWDVPKLLEQLAKKAGLTSGDWREAELRVFQAEVFGDAIS